MCVGSLARANQEWGILEPEALKHFGRTQPVRSGSMSDLPFLTLSLSRFSFCSTSSRCVVGV